MLANRTFRIASFAASLSLSLAPLAAAAPASAPDSVALQVSTDGLDLTQQSDQARLRHRVSVAASRLCAQVTGATSLTDPGFEACFHQAAAEGRQQAEVRIAAAQGSALVATAGR
jgi:UrcA family protein